MKTYLAIWPNKSISLVRAGKKWDLFDQLDREGNPMEAKIHELPRDWCSLRTTFEEGSLVVDGVYTLNEDSLSLDELKAVNLDAELEAMYAN